MSKDVLSAKSRTRFHSNEEFPLRKNKKIRATNKTLCLARVPNHGQLWH